MSTEPSLRFECFGGEVALHAGGDGATSAAAALLKARQRLLDIHARLSRFLPRSELSLINASPLPAVQASDLALLFAEAAIDAAKRSGGLVDATLIGEIERAGYRESRIGTGGLQLEEALRLAPQPRPAAPNPRAAWRALAVDRETGTIARPPGLRLDSGGVAKGLAADLVAASLRDFETFAVDCCGDLRIGGRSGAAREVRVDDPFGRGVLHTYLLGRGAAATSGIGRRAWLTGSGEPAHHLLDPSTGLPAYTGVVQVTALAPTTLSAEVLAKTALLRGAAAAAASLPFGGCIVFDDGTFELVRGAPLASAIPAPAERAA
jgi:FAD:protein FMN transferase